MPNQTTTRRIQEGFNPQLGKNPERNVAGRPLKIKSPEELRVMVKAYFKKCDNRQIEEWDSRNHRICFKRVPEPYTMSGLAYALGMDRQGILTYGRRKRFYDIINKARQRVMIDSEKRLHEGKNVIGAIFALKNNFDWKDRTEIDSTIAGQKIGGFVVIKDSVPAKAVKAEATKPPEPPEQTKTSQPDYSGTTSLTHQILN